MRSMRNTEKPGVSCSIRNALMPKRPAFRLIVANVMTVSARAPFVMKHLVPLSTQPRAVLRADVCIAVASDPHSGSVIANAPQRGASQ